jgi:hypothetical protein
MSNQPIDAMVDELMILPQLQARRPIGAKIPMRSIKNPQARYNEDHPDGERRGIERKISESKNIEGDPEEGQQNAAYCGEHYECDIKAALPVLVGFDGFVSFNVRLAKKAEHQKADYKDGFAEPNVHIAASWGLRAQYALNVWRDKGSAPMTHAPLTFDAVRRIGLSLPEVVESTIHGHPSLKLRGKLLACVAVHKSVEANSALVRLDLGRRASLIDERPEIYYITEHYAAYSTVLVRLSRIGRVELKALLNQAWNFVTAGKSAAAASTAKKASAEKVSADRRKRSVSVKGARRISRTKSGVR